METKKQNSHATPVPPEVEDQSVVRTTVPLVRENEGRQQSQDAEKGREDRNAGEVKERNLREK